MGTRKGALAIFVALSVLWLIGVAGSIGHAAGDVLLTGKVTSGAGEKMEGVTVSARQLGRTFTTSVFTDAAGEYYFPRLEAGKYKFWVQAVGYDAAIREDLALAGTVHHEDIVLKPLQNYEMQLRGDEWLASLPTETDYDKKMKEVFRLNCLGGCHSPTQALKDRFDEKGWKNIIDLMSRLHSYVVYPTEQDVMMPALLHYWRDDLAAYLAKVRGPVPGAMKLTTRPRPKGEEALAVFREYDNGPSGAGAPLYNDGSLWQLGPGNKSDLRNQGGVRGTVDFDGNPWFNVTGKNRLRSFAKIDWKSGKFTNYLISPPEAKGDNVTAGEFITDFEGNVWTRTQSGSGGYLVRVDRSGKMDLIKIPSRASLPRATSTASTASGSADRLVRVWWEEKSPAECAEGVCRNPPQTFWMYEPKTQRWAVYDNPPPPKGMKAFPDVYNRTSGGDSDGNGWWAQYGTDVIVKADVKNPGKVLSAEVPNRQNPAWELFKGDDREIFEMIGGSDPEGKGMPNHHTFRMIGAGPGPSDSVWASGWYSGDLVRVNSRTLKVTVYKSPFGPDCFSYMDVVDPKGMVWSICQSTDVLRRFDPKTEQWSQFRIPTLNVDAHNLGVSPVLIDGRVRLVVPSWANGKIILMDVRTQEDVQALRADVQGAR